MQKHAMALGYFSLAVFCIYVSENANYSLHSVLTIAATLAFVLGSAFFVAATIAHIRSAIRIIRSAPQFVVDLTHDAQRPPDSTPMSHTRHESP